METKKKGKKNKLPPLFFFEATARRRSSKFPIEILERKKRTMTRNIRVRVPPPPGVTLIPEFITEEEEEVTPSR